MNEFNQHIIEQVNVNKLNLDVLTYTLLNVRTRNIKQIFWIYQLVHISKVFQNILESSLVHLAHIFTYLIWQTYQKLETDAGQESKYKWKKSQKWLVCVYKYNIL